MLLLHHHHSNAHTGPPPLISISGWGTYAFPGVWTWPGLGGVGVSWELAQEQQQRGKWARVGGSGSTAQAGLQHTQPHSW